MYSLSPGFRVPAIQRGLSPLESMLTKINLGAGGTLVASTMIGDPPFWAFGAVVGAAGLINVTAGRRSLARWATVGVRHWRERRTTPTLAMSEGETRTWTLYPYHGTMQDPVQRIRFHAAFGKVLTFVGNRARTAGIQVHVTHHAQVGDYTNHTQTISVHVPKNLVTQPKREIATIERQFSNLGQLTRHKPADPPLIVERAAGWARLEDDRYAATARITGWPAEADGDLMSRFLLEQDRESVADGNDDGDFDDVHTRAARTDRSLAVLYRPLPTRQARNSEKWRRAAGEAFTIDKVEQDEQAEVSGSRHESLVRGSTVVDLDAYLTVWSDSPETITEARWATQLEADDLGIRLDWLTAQQNRAHLMTTPHGASARKGVIL